MSRSCNRGLVISRPISNVWRLIRGNPFVAGWDGRCGRSFSRFVDQKTRVREPVGGLVNITTAKQTLLPESEADFNTASA